ncbi:MAG: NAD(P)H-dependent oxidoreductase [Synergistaceae bacterium]|nr:NAD(P)H-dependent oxidoreductase [Synergistaceae bacterium]
MKKRILKYVIYSVIVIAAIAGAVGGFHLYRVSARNAEEMAQYSGSSVSVNVNLGKVLVVYYSLSGRTREIAELVQSKTGADIFEIVPAEEIKSGISLYFNIRNDLKNGTYPALQGDIPNMEEYDVVFVGSPVWWYTVSTPVLAFLEKADFKGKKVVPFSTQGSNAGTFLEDFVRSAKNANVTGYLSFNNMGKEYDKAIDNKISVWLNGLAP